jgi:hypothetical protein
MNWHTGWAAHWRLFAAFLLVMETDVNVSLRLKGTLSTNHLASLFLYHPWTQQL